MGRASLLYPTAPVGQISPANHRPRGMTIRATALGRLGSLAHTLPGEFEGKSSWDQECHTEPVVGCQ